MIYVDRNGNRTEKTTGQDRFLEYIYGHTLTRMMLKPLLGSGVSRLGGKVLDSRVSFCRCRRCARCPPGE